MNTKKKNAKTILKDIVKENKPLIFFNISSSIKEIISPEKIKLDDFSFLARYVKGEGILLYEKLDSIEKTVLLIHEYQHYYLGQTSPYLSQTKELVDDDVRDAIEFLRKNNKDEIIAGELEDLSNTPFYRKLFNAEI